MGWNNKYKVVGIVPGLIVSPWGEQMDLSNPTLPEEKIKRLFEAGCPYIIEKPVEQIPEKPKSTTPEPPQIPPKNLKYGNQKKS